MKLSKTNPGIKTVNTEVGHQDQPTAVAEVVSRHMEDHPNEQAQLP